jgi:hypothetical protein
VTDNLAQLGLFNPPGSFFCTEGFLARGAPDIDPECFQNKNPAGMLSHFFADNVKSQLVVACCYNRAFVMGIAKGVKPWRHAVMIPVDAQPDPQG